MKYTSLIIGLIMTIYAQEIETLNGVLAQIPDLRRKLWDESGL